MIYKINYTMITNVVQMRIFRCMSKLEKTKCERSYSCFKEGRNKRNNFSKRKRERTPKKDMTKIIELSKS